MTRALITGASGFVGSHLAEHLIAHTDWDLDLMIRWRSSLDNLATMVLMANIHTRVRFLYADLHDAFDVGNAVEASAPDYVFHLAAQSFPKTSFASPLDTLDVNIQGTVRLMEALRRYAPNAVIHACSSSEVYGCVPRGRIPINEDCPFHPASPYAISKVGTDLVAQHYAQAYGMNIMVTRMFTHTGPRRGDVFAESSFAKQIAMIEAGMLPPVVKVGNVDSMRTLADVRDAVRAYRMLLTVNPKPGAVYNIGGRHSLRIAELVKYLIKLSPMAEEIRTEIDQERLRPIDADNQIPDTRKFTEATGWEPQITFHQTMLDLLNFWRDRVKHTVPLQR